MSGVFKIYEDNIELRKGDRVLYEVEPATARVCRIVDIFRSMFTLYRADLNKYFYVTPKKVGVTFFTITNGDKTDTFMAFMVEP